MTRRPALACTASASVASALLHDGRITVGAEGDLAVQVQGLLRAADLRAADLTELRVDVGPGSYTGLRVAVTFARFLAAFGGAELRTLTRFEIVAAGLFPEPATARLRFLIDARRDRLCTACVDVGERITLRAEPRTLSREDLLAELEGEGVSEAGRRWLPDERALGFAREHAPAHGASVVEHPLVCDARSMFDARLGARVCPPALAEPLYPMGSYVED